MHTNFKLFVIQALDYCNLNCSYCYLPGRQNKTLMKEAVLESIFKKLSITKNVGKEVIINWHLGEPLAAGLEFFNKIVRYTNIYKNESTDYYHTIQSNGTLINDDWCKFFKDNNFHISVSIDGPEFLHNKYRKNWVGHPSFKKVMKGIKKLQEYGIPVRTISVITEDSLKYASQMYYFFKENNISSVSFSIEEIESNNTTSSLGEKGDDFLNVQEKYRQFLIEFYDLWVKGSRPFHVREFSRVYYNLSNIPCDNNKYDDGLGLGNVAIDYLGNFSSFSPEMISGTTDSPNKFIIDNIKNINSFDDVFKFEKYSSIFNEIKNGVNKCSNECEYFSVCGGGFPSNKFYENGSFESTETISCILNVKTLFNTFINDLIPTR